MESINLPTKRDMTTILGKEFFNEEIRCDFCVTQKIKKTWAVNIDLYLEFAEICDKYKLDYFAYAGTLLGAVRHKGFIPWDDDMDVCMPRGDYEEFLAIAPGLLSDPFFLQTPYTEPGYYRTMSRLSNKSTTRMSKFFKHSGMSHGLILDIFPLDNCLPETNEQDIKEILPHAKRCSQFLKRNDTDIMTPEHFASWKAFMTDNPMEEWKCVQKIAMKNNNIQTAYCCMKVVVIPNSRYNAPLKKEWFSTKLKTQFEGIDIQIPGGFDEFLTATYGDYMAFPPVEQRGTWHHDLIIDPERPYTDYL